MQECSAPSSDRSGSGATCSPDSRPKPTEPMRMRFRGPSSPIVEVVRKKSRWAPPRLVDRVEAGSMAAWARRPRDCLFFYYRQAACCNLSTTQPLNRCVCPGHFQSSNVFPRRTHVCNVHMDTYIQDTTGRKAWLHNSVWGLFLFLGLRNLTPTYLPPRRCSSSIRCRA
jgi:hypothetical protein